SLLFFLLTHTAPTQIYTLSLHDAFRSIPCIGKSFLSCQLKPQCPNNNRYKFRSCHRMIRSKGSIRISFSDSLFNKNADFPFCPRSEEHTSELQSRENLVCRLLLEKKKK